jgi:hypothetical protein
MKKTTVFKIAVLVCGEFLKKHHLLLRVAVDKYFLLFKDQNNLKKMLKAHHHIIKIKL